LNGEVLFAGYMLRTPMPLTHHPVSDIA